MNKSQYEPDRNNSWRQKLEDRMERTEKDVSTMKENIGKILSLLSSPRRNDRSRSISSSPARSPSRRTDRCYSCNEQGNYSNECPKKRRVSSPLNSLNGQGTGM